MRERADVTKDDVDVPSSDLDRHAESMSVADRLADFFLKGRLGRRGGKQLAEMAGGLGVIVVPSPSWCEPIAERVTALMRSPSKVLVAKVAAKGRDRDLGPKAVAALAEGRSVVIVTAADDLVPANLTAMADLRVVIEPPGAADLENAIRTITGGRVGSLAAGLHLGLDFDDLVAAFRADTAPRAVIDRLKRIAEARHASSDTSEPTPPLAVLAPEGSIAEWVRDVVADVERLRRGETVRLSSALLYGVPGTGKTAVVGALARHTGLALVQTSVAAWFTDSAGHLDAVIKEMSRVFGEAKDRSPSVLFLDEIDAVPDRAKLEGRGLDWWTPIVTGLILEIDRLRRSERAVLLTAATNHLVGIDAALRRPGRFDRLIEISVPSGRRLEPIVAHHLGGGFREEVIRDVAEMIGRATGADVAEIVRRARRRAQEEARDLEPKDLEAVILPKDDRPTEQRHAVARHEAAHALLAHRFGAVVSSVSIVATGTALGHTEIRWPECLLTRRELETRVVVALAGRAADVVLGDGGNAGAIDDLGVATRLIAEIHFGAGLGERLIHLTGGADPLGLISRDPRKSEIVEAHLRRSFAEAQRQVEDLRLEIEALARCVIERRILSRDFLYEWFGRRSVSGTPEKVDKKEFESPGGSRS